MTINEGMEQLYKLGRLVKKIDRRLARIAYVEGHGRERECLLDIRRTLQDTIKYLAKEASEYISTVDDPILRDVLSMRYIACMSWRSVAYAIKGNTTDSVRMIVKRHWKEKRG